MRAYTIHRKIVPTAKMCMLHKAYWRMPHCNPWRSHIWSCFRIWLWTQPPLVLYSCHRPMYSLSSWQGEDRTQVTDFLLIALLTTGQAKPYLAARRNPRHRLHIRTTEVARRRRIRKRWIWQKWQHHAAHSQCMKWLELTTSFEQESSASDTGKNLRWGRNVIKPGSKMIIEKIHLHGFYES